MQEQSWADGYVVDVGYTHGFYSELTPALLRFVTLLGEVKAVDIDKPFTYYELGCGNGHTTALLAAANPAGRFIGIDFNPTHVHNARILAEEGGMGNVEFLEKSFSELAGIELPEADLIALHGVYSWVSAENRRHIIDFIRRRLKPAGIVYISYNSLPGLSQVAPLQKLLLDHSNAGTGPLPERIGQSLDFVRRLEEAGAEYFRVSPFARMRLDSLGRQNRNYLAHEYYNASWMPFYHADIAADMGQAKMTYAGSAFVIDNFDQFMLTPGMASLVAENADPAMKETIKDFARNKVFRKDVFTRGASTASPPEMTAMLGNTRFALARPRSSCRLNEKTPAGELTLQAEAYAPVLDALARSPMTFEELRRARETSKLNHQQVRQAVFGMAALRNIVPALPAADEEARRASTSKFNKAALVRPMTGGNVMLASPVLGSGVGLNMIERLLLGGPRKHGDAVEHALKAFLESGVKIRKGDKPVESMEDTRAMIDERAAFFLGELLPFFRQIGIAE